MKLLLMKQIALSLKISFGKIGLFSSIVFNAAAFIRTIRLTIHKDYFPQKTDFKDFSRKADYDKGILKDIEPDVKEVIRRELHLTDWQMQNLVFLVDTTHSGIGARAHVNDGNVIVFNNEMYQFARKGLDSNHVNLSWKANELKGTINAKIPPQLALRIFLGICSHEIEHIRRFLVRSVLDYESRADAGVLDKHQKAMYVFFHLNETVMCYGSDIDDSIKMLLVTDGKKRKNELTIRQSIFENNSEQLYHEMYPHSNHPSHKERADYFKDRGQKTEKKPTKSLFAKQECAQITVSEDGFLWSTILQKIESCESFVDNIV